MNHVIITGRVGSIKSGEKSCFVSLALNTKNREGKEFTDWVPVILFDGISKIFLEHCKTGQKVTISGRLRDNNYEGNRKLQVICDRLEF